MTTKEEILGYKERYTMELYSLTRKAQEEDELYYKDTFPVPEVKEPHHIYRSGIGVRIVDAPAEHIVTRNPQAFFDVRKGGKEAGLRISEVVNQVWLDILRRQNPSIFKENIKQQLGYGEAYIKVLHNDNWVKGNRIDLPIHFIALNPMVVYGSPEENVNGIPDRVIVLYQRQLSDVIVRYPNWSDSKKAEREKSKSQQVEWFEFWDKDVRYFEADGEPVLNGEIQPNIYGFAPFIRKYSGFGRRAPDGELSSLIVSDIRYSRDLIREECATRSNIASVEYLFAHKPKTVIVPVGTDINKLKDELGFGAYDLNVITSSDVNAVKFIDTDIKISPESLTHHANIRAELNQRHPFIIAGFPMGASGRQQDMTEIAAMRRYDSIVENTENTFATALEMAFKEMKIVGIKPDELRDSDLDVQFKCEVKLKAVEAIEMDRQQTLGARQYQIGVLSLKSLHMDYMGMTEDEHKEEVAEILADKVTFQDPVWASVIGQAAAQEGGMAQQLEVAKQAVQENLKSQVKQAIPQSTMERVQGEVETPMGQEMGTAPRIGARQSPERFVRER